MKRTITILIHFLLFLFLFSSCSDSVDTEPSKIKAFVELEYTTRRLDFNNHEWISDPSVNCYGSILSKNKVSFNNFIINGVVNNRYSYSSVAPEIIFKDTIYNAILEPEYDIFDLDIKISTDSGDLEGEISIPDISTNFIATPNDSIGVGDSLVISWENDNADFYILRCLYVRQFFEGDSAYTEIVRDDIISSENSYTISGSHFDNAGRFIISYMNTYSGPIPNSGAEPNLTGGGDDNYGYMYYKTLYTDYEGEIITVGDYIPQKGEDEKLTEEIEKYFENEGKSGSLIKKYLGL